MNKVTEQISLENMERKTISLQQQIESANSRYDSLLQKHRSLSAKIDSDRKITTAQSAEISKLKLNQNFIDTELQEKNDEIEVLKRHCESLQLSINMNAKAEKDASIQLADLREELAKMEDQLEMERYSNELKASEIQSLQSEISSMTSSHKSKIVELSTTINLLTHGNVEEKRLYSVHIQELETKNKRLQNEIDSIKKSDVQASDIDSNHASIKSVEAKIAIESSESFIPKQYIEPYIACIKAVTDLASKLKLCMRTRDINVSVPFLEEARNCYNGTEIADDVHRELINSYISVISVCFQDIARIGMRYNLSPEENGHGAQNVTEQLIQSKIELADAQFEVEELKTALKLLDKKHRVSDDTDFEDSRAAKTSSGADKIVSGVFSSVSSFVSNTRRELVDMSSQGSQGNANTSSSADEESNSSSSLMGKRWSLYSLWNNESSPTNINS